MLRIFTGNEFGVQCQARRIAKALARQERIGLPRGGQAVTQKVKNTKRARRGALMTQGFLARGGRGFQRRVGAALEYRYASESLALDRDDEADSLERPPEFTVL